MVIQRIEVNKYKSRLLLVASLLLPVSATAEHNHPTGPDAPIGIMGNHIHPEGEWMMSYSIKQMQMDGNRTDTDRVSTPLAGYMVSPLSMDMTMHMLGVMTGYSENITLMAMLPITSISMDHIVNANGMPFTTEASGMGDLKLSALINTAENWITGVGLNLPTGSIEEKDVTPMSSGVAVQLPYPMQLGSGSVDLLAGITYTNNNQKNSWGTQAEATVRLNDNDRDYRLGNRFAISSWYSFGINEKNSTSVRIKIEDWGNISGADADLNPMMVPTAETDLRAGTRADILLGYNYQLSKHYLIGLEIGAPIYQKLDGPQLETDLSMQLGVQYAF